MEQPGPGNRNVGKRIRRPSSSPRGYWDVEGEGQRVLNPFNQLSVWDTQATADIAPLSAYYIFIDIT